MIDNNLSRFLFQINKMENGYLARMVGWLPKARFTRCGHNNAFDDMQSLVSTIDILAANVALSMSFIINKLIFYILQQFLYFLLFS